MSPLCVQGNELADVDLEEGRIQLPKRGNAASDLMGAHLSQLWVDCPLAPVEPLKQIRRSGQGSRAR